MKFRDGMWLTAEGLGVSYAEEVYSIKKTDRGLSLLCPTRKIRSRGDSLNLATLTIVRPIKQNIWHIFEDGADGGPGY